MDTKVTHSVPKEEKKKLREGRTIWSGGKRKPLRTNPVDVAKRGNLSRKGKIEDQ